MVESAPAHHCDERGLCRNPADEFGAQNQPLVPGVLDPVTRPGNWWPGIRTVGRDGYDADLSRPLSVATAGHAHERNLYRMADDEIQTKMAGIGRRIVQGIRRTGLADPDLLQGTASFRVADGVGMTGEYPYIVHREDIDDKGYDADGTGHYALCGKSIGDEDGGEGDSLKNRSILVLTAGSSRDPIILSTRAAGPLRHAIPTAATRGGPAAPSTMKPDEKTMSQTLIPHIDLTPLLADTAGRARTVPRSSMPPAIPVS